MINNGAQKPSSEAIQHFARTREVSGLLPAHPEIVTLRDTELQSLYNDLEEPNSSTFWPYFFLDMSYELRKKPGQTNESRSAHLL